MSLRDGPLKNMKVPLTWAAAAAAVIALAIAIALIFTDRRETLDEGAYNPIRQTVDRVQAPLGGVLSAPVRWVGNGINGVKGYFGAVSENRRLKAEIEAMGDLEAEVARLEDLNGRYAELLSLRTDPPIDMVTGLAVTDSRGPFAHSRLINVGADAGVKVGNPVMSEHGLVGRVVGVTGNISRVLMLTDVASRTPVMIDRTNSRAILTGDGGGNPELAYLRSRDPPVVGDVVVTSGDGGLMPRGLPVGVVVRGVDGAWRVRLASDQAPIDFVRVLKFESFAQLADAERLANSARPEDLTIEGAPSSSQPAQSRPAPPPTPQPRASTPPPPSQPAPQPARPVTPTPEPTPPSAAEPVTPPPTQPAPQQAPPPQAQTPAQPQPAAPQPAQSSDPVGEP